MSRRHPTPPLYLGVASLAIMAAAAGLFLWTVVGALIHAALA